MSGTQATRHNGGSTAAPSTAAPERRQAASPGGTCSGGRPGPARTYRRAPRRRHLDRQAARVIASHPEQGWSLLCNGVVVFDDAGALLPDGSVIEPERMTCQPGIAGTPQAGHARTVAPVPPGVPVKEGCASQVPPRLAQPLSHRRPGMAAGSRQHPARMRGWRVPAQAVPPHRGHRERMAADAW